MTKKRVLLALYGLITAVGMTAWMAADTPRPATPPIAADTTPTSTGPVNWASVWQGGRVRASGWDQFRSHHPLFAIDAEAHPDTLEKWATRAEQPFPWLEVLLERPRRVHEIVLRHAGSVESADYTNDRYVIQCFRGDTLVDEVGVIDNRADLPRYPVNCPATDRLRISFDCTGPVDVVRLYEVEAWGDP